MEEEKNILLIVDGVPKVNYSVTKNNTVADLKNILKQFPHTKVTFSINDETQVPVFDSNQYDKLSLASVWGKMTKPRINLLTSKLLPLNEGMKEERKEENREVALSGIKDVDYIILQNLSDQDLGNFCRVNKEARKLCTDDTFWRNRTMKRFSSVISQDVLIKNKEANFKTWREYYINLVDFLEKIYMGFLIGLEIPGQRRKLMEKEYMIKESRDDLQILHNIVEENSERLSNLENVKKMLAEDFVDPNYFFFSEFEVFEGYGEPEKEEELIESIKLIGADHRFRPERALYELITDISSVGDDYETYINTLSPYFTKENLLNVLRQKLSDGDLFVSLKQSLLPLAVKKGATKDDIKDLLKVKLNEDDEERYYKRAIEDIKQFLKKMK